MGRSVVLMVPGVVRAAGLRSGMSMAAARRGVRWALLVVLLSVCWLDYGLYREAFHASPDAWMDVVRGSADAPQQYRVGVVRTAFWMTEHSGLKLQHALALLDTAGALLAGFLLLSVLERTAVFRRAGVAAQRLGYAGFVGLAGFYLLWAMTPQKPETLSAAGLLALMVWLWQAARPAAAWRVVGLVAAALVLGFVRADVGCALSVGVLVVALWGRAELGLARGVAVLTALACAAVCAGVQWWLMRVVYPNAGYGRVKMWQLRPNLVHATRWPGFVLFVVPVVWTLVVVWRRRFAEDGVGLAVVVGAALYAVAWVTVGKVDEVRIFVPMAMALAPLTVEMMMMRAAESEGGAAGAG
jgi:hypothetical protein